MVDYKEEHLDRLFLALSDQTRRRMLMMLSKQSRSVSELGKPFDLTKQSVSKHLRVLEDAHLITKKRDGRTQNCSLNPNAIDAIQKVVGQYQAFWSERMDELDDYIEVIKNRKESHVRKATA